MSRHGYGCVPEKGFLSFLPDLSQGAWRDIAIKKPDNADQVSGLTVHDGSLLATLKLRGMWAIEALRNAVGAGVEALAQLDDEWSSHQRKLRVSLGMAGEDDDKATREAAARLRDVLILGKGTGQTMLGWNEEVDFGRRQVELTARGALAEDARKVGVQALLVEIDLATEALAFGLGRGAGKKVAGARAARVREALVDCAVAFNGIHSDLEWLIDHAESVETRARLEEMLAPMKALLDRYPRDGASGAGATHAVRAAPPGG